MLISYIVGIVDFKACKSLSCTADLQQDTMTGHAVLPHGGWKGEGQHARYAIRLTAD